MVNDIFYDVIQMINISDILLIALLANVSSIITHIIESKIRRGTVRND